MPHLLEVLVLEQLFCGNASLQSIENCQSFSRRGHRILAAGFLRWEVAVRDSGLLGFAGVISDLIGDLWVAAEPAVGGGTAGRRGGRWARLAAGASLWPPD